MTRSERLAPVTRVAESRERRAATELGEQQRIVSDLEARLAELIAYRDEYSGRLAVTGQAGMDAMQLSDYRLFLARLNEAIGYQQQRVAAARCDYEQKKRRWLTTRTKSAALEKVVTRFQDAERREEEHREQVEADERSQRCGSGADIDAD